MKEIKKGYGVPESNPDRAVCVCVCVQQSARLELTARLFIAGTMLITLEPRSGEINPQMSTAVRLSIRGPAGSPTTTHTNRLP
jgi:hypothetical protein